MRGVEKRHGSGDQGDRVQGGFGFVAYGEGKRAAFFRLSGISVGVGSEPFTELVNFAPEEPSDHLRRAVEDLCCCEEGGWHRVSLLLSWGTKVCVRTSCKFLPPFHPHTECLRDLFHMVER